jgi:hypothetical protein
MGVSFLGWAPEGSVVRVTGALDSLWTMGIENKLEEKMALARATLGVSCERD